MNLKEYRRPRTIRDIPDFPTPGILFRDITPLLGSPEAFAYSMAAFEEHARSQEVDAIVGIEARGFLIAAPLARALEKPLVPVRKQGKLPFETNRVTYTFGVRR